MKNRLHPFAAVWNVFFVVVTAVVLMLSACSKPMTSVETVQLDSLCRQLFPANEAGAAVLVMRGDSTLFDRGYGLANLKTKTPIDGNTFFNIASVSKQFTAVAMMQLSEQGRLSLNDAVAQHCSFPQSFWKEVRLRHLLAHSSGVPDERGYLSRQEKIFGTDSLAVAYLPHVQALHFTPGTDYEYINPTFVLAGMIVEQVRGEPFSDYMQRHIFAPANMEAYYFADDTTIIPRMAHAYVNGEEYDYGEETFFATRADGGLYTSTHDFARWEKALRNGILLSDSTLNKAWTPQTQVSGSTWCDYQNRPNTWYGLGWFIEPRTDSTKTVIYHTGDNGGFQILAARYPEDTALVLVFANRNDWNRYQLMQQIEKIYGL